MKGLVINFELDDEHETTSQTNQVVLKRWTDRNKPRNVDSEVSAGIIYASKSKWYAQRNNPPTKVETECFTPVEQDQNLLTEITCLIFFKTVLNLNSESGKFVKIEDHYVLECPMLTSNEYKNSHDMLGQYLHRKPCMYYEIGTLTDGN